METVKFESNQIFEINGSSKIKFEGTYTPLALSEILIKNWIHAIYNTLFEFCINQPTLKEKFYAIRGEILENKIERIFQIFFNGKAIVYRGYYTQDKHEQDLLFLIDGLALIVEAKASKRDEPRREPDKAYPLILSNFEETIQKGYDQAYRVKSKFINKDMLCIYKDQQLTKHVIDIKTKKYYSAFSIVVTLERFGQIQTDLSELLEIWDDDEFPWSVCVDDLEVFLLQLKKMGKKKSDLVNFLNLRQKMHGKLFSNDELEVCGGFLKGLLNHKVVDSDNNLMVTPDLSELFDHTYQRLGLGFENEKYLEMKTSGKYMPIGGF